MKKLILLLLLFSVSLGTRAQSIFEAAPSGSGWVSVSVNQNKLNTSTGQFMFYLAGQGWKSSISYTKVKAKLDSMSLVISNSLNIKPNWADTSFLSRRDAAINRRVKYSDTTFLNKRDAAINFRVTYNDTTFLSRRDEIINNRVKYSDTTFLNRRDVVINHKVDKITGKGLSANDFTNADSLKLINLDNDFVTTNPSTPQAAGTWVDAYYKVGTSTIYSQLKPNTLFTAGSDYIISTSTGKIISIYNGGTQNVTLGASGTQFFVPLSATNLAGTNTGDNAVNTLYSGLVSNATHTGDVTGSTVLTLANVNINTGGFGNSTTIPHFVVNEKGLITSASSFAIPIASSSNNGLLSSSNWSVFAGKQAAYPNLTAIGTMTVGAGWVYTDGSGFFAPSIPSKSDVGLGNVTNNTQWYSGNHPTTLSGYGITDTPWLGCLPLSGGTLTGALIGTSAIFSLGVTATSFVKSGGTRNQPLMADGSVWGNIIVITSDYTVQSTDDIIICNSPGYITVTLPAAVSANRKIILKNIGTPAVTIVVSGNGFLDDSHSYVLYQWDAATVFDNSGKYLIL
jgi:hypothetical protein